jgi:hypothetical protein
MSITSTLPAPLRRTPSAVRTLYLLAFPHGGQRSARSNAWAGMSADLVRSRDRSEADDALRAAIARARPDLRSGTGW